MARWWACSDCPRFGLHPAAAMSTDPAARSAKLIPLDHKGVQRPVSASRYCTSCQHPRRFRQTLSLLRTPASHAEAMLHLQHAKVEQLLASGMSRSVCYADRQRMLAVFPAHALQSMMNPFPPARQGLTFCNSPMIPGRHATFDLPLARVVTEGVCCSVHSKATSSDGEQVRACLCSQVGRRMTARHT
jgi:hypothetical protein